jgi:hypothetical protein
VSSFLFILFIILKFQNINKLHYSQLFGNHYELLSSWKHRYLFHPGLVLSVVYNQVFLEKQMFLIVALCFWYFHRQVTTNSTFGNHFISVVFNRNLPIFAHFS